MKVFDDIIDLLNNHKVDYQHVQHEPTPTSEDSAKVRGDKLSMGAKAIVYKVQDQYALFVLAADRKLDPKLIKSHFKSKGMRVKKTRFATSDELMKLTGLVPGSVPPFGKPILNLDLYVDPSLLANETISFNAGSLTNSIKMELSEYTAISRPEIFSFMKTEKIDD